MQQTITSTPRARRIAVAVAVAVAATALAGPAAADAAKYRGKASGQTIRFNQKGKRISKVRTLIFVVCSRSDTSEQDSGFEIFDPPGKFRLGKETRRNAHRKASVRPGEYGFNFTVIPRRKSRRKIAGRIRLTYFESVYDPFTNQIYYWNCYGTSKFRATKR
jgi:hypothetical protein